MQARHEDNGRISNLSKESDGIEKTKQYVHNNIYYSC